MAIVGLLAYKISVLFCLLSLLQVCGEYSLVVKNYSVISIDISSVDMGLL